MRLTYIVLFIILSYASPIFGQINIWEGVDKHEKVMMTPYLAPGTANKSIIICPGGSYFWLAHKTEGHSVARWLQSNGISSFVLNYRVAKFPAFVLPYRYFFRGNRYPDAQDDLKQAIRIVKKKAEEYGIDKNKIGAMGFSAGGHLVMSAAELFDKEDRPAFVAPIYPVVTMESQWVHKRSRRALLGDDCKRDKQMKDSLSLEKHVPDDCPPVFLLSCKDDPIVHYQNSELLDSALNAKKINHKYITYNTGGHGFGADPKKGTPESRQWKKEFLNWIKSIDL